MASLTLDDHVLPRPVERLPDYAHAKARQNLAEKIAEAFGLSEASAAAICQCSRRPERGAQVDR